MKTLLSRRVEDDLLLFLLVELGLLFEGVVHEVGGLRVADGLGALVAQDLLVGVVVLVRSRRPCF